MGKCYMDGGNRIMGLTWLAIGDSITFGTGSSTFDKSYIMLTRTELLKNSKKHELVNSAVSGQRSDTLINLHKARGGKCDADLITIMAGTNDAGQDISTSVYKTNLGLLVDEVKKNSVIGQCKIVLLTVPWRGDKDIPSYNAIVQQVAAEKNLPVCDIYPAFNSNADLTDGVHPNDSGHSKIANILAPFLNGLDVWNNTRRR